MDSYKLNQIVAALNKKNVTQPCPRCATKNFSVVGESEISVIKPHVPALGFHIGLPTPTKSTMPTIIVTCDNCGYISQHAQATLGLLSPPAGLGITRLGGI